jgi:hypothetical protein
LVEFDQIKNEYGRNSFAMSPTVSRKEAEEKVEVEDNKFNKTQKIKSDFDRLLDETKKMSDK